MTRRLLTTACLVGSSACIPDIGIGYGDDTQVASASEADSNEDGEADASAHGESADGDDDPGDDASADGGPGVDDSAGGVPGYEPGMYPDCGDGVEDPGEACDDGNTDSTDGCLDTCEAATSCQLIHDVDPAAASGVYTLDVEGQRFDVYCDMHTDGGGWTLIARFANTDLANWMGDGGAWWHSKTDEAGIPTDRGDNADMISSGFWLVRAEDLKLGRTDNPDDAHLVQTVGSCLGGQTFRRYINSFGDFRGQTIWGLDSVADVCPATLGKNFADSNGFGRAECSEADIGMASSLGFWADWAQGDGAVIMIGGGGHACGRADHGIGITEANSANFGPTGEYEGLYEDDFGDDASSDQDDAYALNLFVR